MHTLKIEIIPKCVGEYVMIFDKFNWFFTTGTKICQKIWFKPDKFDGFTFTFQKQKVI